MSAIPKESGERIQIWKTSFVDAVGSAENASVVLRQVVEPALSRVNLITRSGFERSRIFTSQIGSA